MHVGLFSSLLFLFFHDAKYVLHMLFSFFVRLCICSYNFPLLDVLIFVLWLS